MEGKLGNFGKITLSEGEICWLIERDFFILLMETEVIKIWVWNRIRYPTTPNRNKLKPE